MINTKNILIICSLVSIISVPIFARAIEFNLPSSEKIFETVIAPIRDFVGSFGAESFDDSSGSLSDKVSDFDLGIDITDPSSIYDKVDTWFFDTTGVYLSEVFNRVWQLVLWFVGIIPGLYNWVVSLINN